MTKKKSRPGASSRRSPIAAMAGAAIVLLCLCGVARAQTTKTFINYFKPTPITCPLTTNAWGCTASGSTPSNCVAGTGVVPRDTCNGIESASNPPQYYYWDGTLIHAADGTYHLFADRWPGTSGFGAWTSSDPIHAVGGSSPFGPFTDKGYAYSNPSFGGDQHHGHNSQVVTLLDGTYGLIVSEVVPFTVFTASSLDGPWTPCSGSPAPGLSVPSGFGGNTSYASNVSMVVRPDGNFEITQRHGLIALSTSGICGPYKAQQPTNTYPSSEAIPTQYAASIYPNKQKHSDPMGPSTVESTYTLAEDPVIWFSGGLYHVLYDYPDDRVGYHLTSTDGIHNWTDQGLAYDPRYAQQIFSYTDGTIDHWYKMERPNVLLENGHVTHLTFAVSDVDKNNQIPAGSNHGSKVIVIPFDGTSLDCDLNPASCGATLDAGAAGGSGGTADARPAGSGGASGAGGGTGTSAGNGGSSRDAGSAASGGAAGAGGASARGGANGGSSGAGGTSAATGGSDGSGGASSSGGRSLAGGAVASGGSANGGARSGGATGSASSGGASSGGTSTGTTASSSSGCSCAIQGARGPSAGGLMLLFGLATLLIRRRRLP